MKGSGWAAMMERVMPATERAIIRSVIAHSMTRLDMSRLWDPTGHTETLSAGRICGAMSRASIEDRAGRGWPLPSYVEIATVTPERLALFVYVFERAIPFDIC
jgi:hypothetical protein